MESVELDAKRAKQIVEIKLQEKDIKGAICFSEKVQSLFPELKRIFQFIGNLDVHVYNEDEEIDWQRVYLILKRHIKFLIQRGVYCLINLKEKHIYDLRRSRAMQQNALIVGQATSANENISKAFSNVDNAVISNQKRLRNNRKTGARDQRSNFGASEEILVHNRSVLTKIPKQVMLHDHQISLGPIK
ncbi:hypothetical protein POM88_023820 [Heracleum sosnowskyi]|uniref:Uncharacterized protein n=1 Tax=Heracleum sosnowskyi TaxID=360622 RepID=A0AAD8MQT0_9APIA|nr:hypothetical protein POM88_023820 [Heracleum sosnowskyi]